MHTQKKTELSDYRTRGSAAPAVLVILNSATAAAAGGVQVRLG